MYDWLDLLISNPDKRYEDFSLAGVTDTNISIKDKDDYKEIPEIQRLFTNAEGNFDEDSFSKFYDNASKSFSDFASNQASIKEFSTDLDKIREKKRLSGDVYLRKVANPLLQSKGLEGVFNISDGLLSKREARQRAEVRDWRTGESLGWTPNDDDKRGFLDFMFTEPVVEAVWDEDGYHVDPMTGQTVHHFAGEDKTDENGNYYYENLGDRDASGRSFLKVWDTLTVDGTTWNKFDPFDADGVSQSVGAQVLKTAAVIAPLLIPGVREAYGYAVAGALLSDALATFGKAGTEALDSDYKNNPLWNKFNSFGAFMRRFDNSSSDENGYFEQGTNMLSSVASQLYQQRAIAQIPQLLKWNKSETKIVKDFIQKNGDSYLKQYGKTLTKALKDGDIQATSLLGQNKLLEYYNNINKMGKRAADASKLYMVATQTQGVYDTFKENGFDETTTALGVLGTAYGFHKLFNTSLGELALSGLGLDELGQSVKAVTNKMATGFNESLAKLVPAVEKNASKSTKLSAIRQYGDKFVDLFKKAVTGPHSLKNDMLRESIEETSEEFLQDVVLASASALEYGLDALGLRESKNTYSWIDTNPLERYLMSAAGGAVGAAVFRGLNKWDDFLRGNKAISELPMDDIKNLIKLSENHTLPEIEAIIQKQIEKGEFGSTVLSGKLVTAEDGSTYYENAKTLEESQNYVIGNTILEIVRSIHNSMNAEIGQLDKNHILNSALGKNIRGRILANESFDVVHTIAEDFNDIVARLVTAKAKLSSVQDGAEPNKADQAEYNQAKADYEKLINGERASDYVERAAFLLNRGVAGLFKDNLDIYTYAASRGINYSLLPEDRKRELDEEFKVAKTKKDTSFEVFKFYRDKVFPDLQNISNTSESVVARKTYLDALKNLKESLVKKYAPEDQIKAFRKQLEDKPLDKYLKEFNLDKFNDATTQEQKEALKELDIDQQVKEYSDGLLTANIKLHNETSLGFDATLGFTPDQQLVEFANTLNQIAQSNQIVDKKLISNLESIYNYFNGFNFNDYSDSLTSLFKQELAGRAFAITDPSKVPSLQSKINNIEEFQYIDLTDDADGNLTLSKNEDNNLYHLEDEGGMINLDIELSDLDLKALLVDAYTTSTDDPQSLVGNIMPNSKGETIKDDSDISKFIKTQLENTFHNNPNIALLQEVNTTLDNTSRKITESPVYSLLGRLSKELTGENVFDILSDENKNLRTLNSLIEYTLTNKITESQLRAALGVITMAAGILRYSKGDADSEFGSMIDIVNESRRGNQLDEIPVIDENVFNFASEDLNLLYKDINLLLEINSKNNVSKTKESTETLLRSEIILLRLLGDTDENKQLFGKEILIDDKPFFDYDSSEHTDLFRSILQKKQDDPKNVEIVDKEFTKMQKYYYDKFQNLTEDQKDEFIKILATIRKGDNPGLNYLDNFDTKLNRNTSSDDMSPEFVGNFIMSTLAVDQSVVKQEFVRALKDSNAYAPFFGQYLSIAMSIANMFNPELINKYTRYKRDLNPELGNTIYENLTVINGDPGSGKTTSVAHFVKTMIQNRFPDARIIAAAPTIDQANKLKSLLGVDSYYKQPLFEEILTQEGLKAYKDVMEDLNSNEGRKYGNSHNLTKVANISTWIKNPGTPLYIIMDEYTHFNGYEMDLLTKIPNVRILALGDNKQEGFKLSSGDPNYASGILYSTPNLMMSVRAANGHKQDNLSILSTILRSTIEGINKSRLEKSIFSSRSTYDRLKDEVRLKYYEGSDGLQGDKITDSISESEVRNLINNLGDGESIALITSKNDSDTIKLFTNLKEEFPDKEIVIRKADDVQGAEFKYVVVDVLYPNVNGAIDDTFNNSFLSAVRAFYTHITRSSSGSIIVSKDNRVPVAGSSKIDYPSNSKLNQEDIDKYRALILNAFSGEESDEKIPEKAPSSKPKVDDKAVEEKRKELTKDDNTDEFKQQHIGVYFGSKRTGLIKNGDQYTPVPNSNEDLNPVLSSGFSSKADLLSSPEYKAWALIKGFAASSDKDAVIRHFRDNPEYLNTFKSYIKLLTGSEDNLTDFLDILQSGKFKIKISKTNKATDYQLYDLSYERKSTNFARIILQLTAKDGKVYDITVADLTDPDKIKNSNFAKILKRDYANPVYFNFDSSKLQYRFLGFSGSNTNEVEIPVSETMKEHPDLTVSSVYYEQYDAKRRGQPYVLASDIVGITEEQMKNLYGSDDRVEKVWASSIKYTYDDYFNTLHNLFVNRHNSKLLDFFKLRKYVPETLGARFVRAAYYLKDVILRDDNSIAEYNEKIKEYNKEAEEENTKAEAAGGKRRKVIKPEITNPKDIRESLNKITSLFEEKLPVNSVEMVAKDATYKGLKSVLTDKGKDLLGDDIQIPSFTDNEIRFLSKFSNKSLKSLFEDLSNPDSPYYQNSTLTGSKSDITGDAEMAEKAKQMLTAIDYLGDTFAGKPLGQLVDWFSKDILIHAVNDLKIVDFFQRLSDKDEEAFRIALATSGMFNEGILSQGRDVESGYDENYIKAATNTDGIYFLKPILPRTAYLDYDSINMKAENQQQSASIEDSYNNKVTELRSQVDPSLQDKFDTLMRKFKIESTWTDKDLTDNLNQYINTNYQSVKQFIWENKPILVSLQWKDGKLLTVKEEINKNILSRDQSNLDILNSLPLNDLNFTEKNGVISMRTENGGSIFTLKLLDNGDIHIEESLISENESPSSNTTSITLNGFKEFLDKIYHLGPDKGDSNLVEELNKTSNSKDRESLVSEYLKRRGKKLGLGGKNALNNYFTTDNKSNC